MKQIIWCRIRKCKKKLFDTKGEIKKNDSVVKRYIGEKGGHRTIAKDKLKRCVVWCEYVGTQGVL